MNEEKIKREKAFYITLLSIISTKYKDIRKHEPLIMKVTNSKDLLFINTEIFIENEGDNKRAKVFLSFIGTERIKKELGPLIKDLKLKEYEKIPLEGNYYIFYYLSDPLLELRGDKLIVNKEQNE